MTFVDNGLIVHLVPVSERVARSYSSPDLRVHLVGDAAYVSFDDATSGIPSTSSGIPISC